MRTYTNGKGRSHGHHERGEGELVDTFRDMAVCSECKRGFSLTTLNGKALVCEDCGHKLVRFYPSIQGQRCSQCGLRFTSEPIDSNTVFGDIINGSRKGLKCYSCGGVIRTNCAAKTDGKIALVCQCGGDLAIQI